MTSVLFYSTDEVTGPEGVTTSQIGRQCRRVKQAAGLVHLQAGYATDEDTGARVKGLVDMAMTSLGHDQGFGRDAMKLCIQVRNIGTHCNR